MSCQHIYNQSAICTYPFSSTSSNSEVMHFYANYITRKQQKKNWRKDGEREHDRQTRSDRNWDEVKRKRRFFIPNVSSPSSSSFTCNSFLFFNFRWKWNESIRKMEQTDLMPVLSEFRIVFFCSFIFISLNVRVSCWFSLSLSLFHSVFFVVVLVFCASHRIIIFHKHDEVPKGMQSSYLTQRHYIKLHMITLRNRPIHYTISGGSSTGGGRINMILYCIIMSRKNVISHLSLSSDIWAFLCHLPLSVGVVSWPHFSDENAVTVSFISEFIQ